MIDRLATAIDLAAAKLPDQFAGPRPHGNGGRTRGSGDRRRTTIRIWFFQQYQLLAAGFNC
jgi:hypothetical protein